MQNASFCAEWYTTDCWTYVRFRQAFLRFKNTKSTVWVSENNMASVYTHRYRPATCFRSQQHRAQRSMYGLNSMQKEARRSSGKMKLDHTVSQNHLCRVGTDDRSVVYAWNVKSSTCGTNLKMLEAKPFNNLLHYSKLIIANVALFGLQFARISFRHDACIWLVQHMWLNHQHFKRSYSQS